MITTPITLQDLRRRLYLKAKAETTWRFWGLYVHVCKMETLHEAYKLAKENDGAPGIDGVTFEVIEEAGVERFLEQIRDELVTRRYRPMRNRRKEIPKGNGKVRVLGIPCIRDRVVQGALKLILEPIFEADFQPGSYGYRPKRTPQEALYLVTKAITEEKTSVIDLDLRAYFDNVRHDILLAKVAQRVRDRDVMHLLKLILTATGKKGVPQGGVISPMLSNIYLNEVDRMLERAKEKTREGRYTRVDYARYADDLVVLVDFHPRQVGLLKLVERRIREEFGKLHVEVNEEKSKVADLMKGESFGFLGFDFRLTRTRTGRWRPHVAPKARKRTELLEKLRKVFQSNVSQPIGPVVAKINPVLRGWVNYFNIGDSSLCLLYVKEWVELKVRRHLERSGKRRGFGWNRWSKRWLYGELGLFSGYRLRPYLPRLKALPAR